MCMNIPIVWVTAVLYGALMALIGMSDGSAGIFVIGVGLVGIGLFGGWWQGDFGNRHTKT